MTFQLISIPGLKKSLVKIPVLLREIMLLMILFVASTLSILGQNPVLLPQAGHTDSAEVIGFGLGGKVIITNSNDKTAKIWNAADGRLLDTTSSLGPVAVSRDGKIVVTVNINRSIKVNNIFTGRKIVINTGFKYSFVEIKAIAIDAVSQNITCLSQESSGPGSNQQSWLNVWRVNGTLIRKIQISKPGTTVETAVFSPDGKYLALALNSNSDGDQTRTFELRSVSNGVRLYLPQILDHDEESLNYVFSPDSRLIASLVWNDKTGSGIKLRKILTGDALPLLKSDNKLYFPILFSPDGKVIAGNVDGKRAIKLWSLETSRPLGDGLEADFQPYSMVFSPKGSILAVGGIKYGTDNSSGVVQLWDWKSKTTKNPLIGQKEYVSSLVFSPDGKILASGGKAEAGGGDSVAKLWNVSENNLSQTLEGYTNLAEETAFSADEKYLVVKNKPWDSSYKEFKPSFVVWDLKNDREPQYFQGEFLSFSPDSKNVFVRVDNTGDLKSDCTQQQNVQPQKTYAIHIIEALTGDTVKTIAGPFCDLENIVISPDGQTIAGGGGYAHNNQKSILRFWDVKSGTVKAETETLTETIPDIFFSPDGKSVITADETNKTFKLWGVDKSNDLKAVFEDAISEGDPVSFAAFSHNGKLLVGISGDGRIPGKNDDMEKPGPSTFRIWKIESSGKPIIKQEVATGLSPTAYFSHNDRILATATSEIDLWDLADLESKQRIRRIRPTIIPDYHDEPEFSTSVIFNRDDTKVLTSVNGGVIQRVEMWQIGRSSELSMLNTVGLEVRHANLSQDANLLSTISTDGMVRLWKMNPERLLVSFISLNQKDWLAAAPDGRFDGTTTAWKKIFWRFERNILNIAPVEIFFNEFFNPGVLQVVEPGRLKPLPKTSKTKDRRQPSVKICLEGDCSSEKGKIYDQRKINVSVNVIEGAQTKELPWGSGAQDVRLFRNGLLVETWKGDIFSNNSGCLLAQTKPGEPRSATCSAKITITAGENNLTTYAFNSDNIKSNDYTIPIKGDDSLKQRGAFRILAIGINDYANKKYKLNFAVADALDLSDEIRRQQEKLGIYDTPKPVILTDKEATKENIRLALSRFGKKSQTALPDNLGREIRRKLESIHPAEPEDVLLVFFSGHGITDNERFYLIPRDLGFDENAVLTNQNKLKILREHSLSDIELEELSRPVDAGQILFIIDACKSGQVITADDPRRGPMNSKGLAQLAYEKGMYILTASTSDQAAMETARTADGTEIKHGLLTYTLLEAIKGTKKELTEREWFAYAVNHVPELQLEMMTRKGEIVIIGNRNEAKLPPEKRGLQTPRVFYRREAGSRPLIVAKP